MGATNVKVTFLSMTQNPEALIYAAYRQCYKAGYVGDDWNAFINGDRDAQIQFIKTMLDTPHESPLEHVSMSFAIAGVSRALSHQLVRHRIASYSQQSQRYVDAMGFDYIMPPAIAAVPEAKQRFEKVMLDAAIAYEEIQTLLNNSGFIKTANEDARFVLPNACETKIVVTMNVRSLLHFFSLRCCQRAQWEIRKMAFMMLSHCKERIPSLFVNSGAYCDIKGYCPELQKFTCGRKPTKDYLLETAAMYEDLTK